MHALFGITLRSELALPLPPCHNHGRADVDVVLGRVDPGPSLVWHSLEPVAFTCTRAGDQIVLDWPGMRFGVSANRVVVDTDDPEAAVIVLLQAVWSVLLTANGREALHASVVARDGQAVAIVGAAGSGKSTAALTLLDRGWQLVADDLLTLDGQGRAIPGPSFIRLTRDRAIGREGEWDAAGKLRYAPACHTEPIPLVALIVHDAAIATCRHLSGIAGVHALLANIYNDVPTHPGQAIRRLELATALANRAAIVGVPPRSLTADQLEHIACLAITRP